MIKKNIVILTILFSLALSSEWINIESNYIENPTFELVSSDINNTLINFNFDDFHLTDVQIDNKNYFTLDIKNGASSLQLGYPDLSHISKSLIIPDNASMNVELVDYDFTEYQCCTIVPQNQTTTKNVTRAYKYLSQILINK